MWYIFGSWLFAVLCLSMIMCHTCNCMYNLCLNFLKGTAKGWKMNFSVNWQWGRILSYLIKAHGIIPYHIHTILYHIWNRTILFCILKTTFLFIFLLFIIYILNGHLLHGLCSGNILFWCWGHWWGAADPGSPQSHAYSLVCSFYFCLFLICYT